MKVDPSRALSPLGYMPALDGLRAIAVGLVFLNHAVMPFMVAGNIGVDIFFVLSGFLITSILVKELDKNGRINLRRFYLRRAIRLYPPLLLAAAVVSVFALIFTPSVIAYLQETFAALFYLTPVSQFVIGDAVVWYHTWTLALEEWYYLIWPAVLLLIFALRWKWERIAWAWLIIGTIFLFAKLGLDLAGFEFGAYLRIGGILIGSAVALFIKDHGIPAWTKKLAPYGLLIIATSVVYGSFGWGESVAFLTAVAGTVMMLPALITGTGMVAGVLKTRPMVYVGTISYELYLWHFPVLVIVAWATGLYHIDVWWWALPLSFGLAVLSHIVLKEPTVRLKIAADAWSRKPPPEPEPPVQFVPPSPAA